MGRPWPVLAGPGGPGEERRPASRLFITQEAPGRVSEWVMSGVTRSSGRIIDPRCSKMWLETVVGVCSVYLGLLVYSH